MFKLIILSCFLSCALAAPGLTHGIAAAPIAVAVATPHIVAPSATSQQSRHDIINPGVITYTTAHVAPLVAATPVVASAPVLTAAPAVRVSSAATSRLDIRRPVLGGIAAAPLGLGQAAGLGGGLGVGGAVGGGGYGLGQVAGLGGGLALGGLGVGGAVGVGGHGYGK